MSQRFLLEFNTDMYGDWPVEVQRMFDAVTDSRPQFRNWDFNGIEKKWHRHHSDPCPTTHIEAKT